MFALILWRWILPSFKKSRPVLVFFKIAGLLVVFMTSEIGISWQYEVFSVTHMILHPSLTVWLNLVIYLVITLVSVAVYFTRESFRNERQKRELMENQLTTELNFLHAQINPHFLFNTLNNLFSIAQRDKNEGLAKSISMLSGLMRYVLYESNASRVSLRKEVNQLKDFIGLACMRFSEEEVKVEVVIEGEIDNATIAPMILLPFVENAFKHGVQIEEISIITISVKSKNGRIDFHCLNRKAAGIQPTIDSSGIGLENVRRRLKLLYSDKHQLQFHETEEIFEVHLTLE
jgi:two-component system LytT family sensor kinase